jgi:beta-N-acetylhexosaminidase
LLGHIPDQIGMMNSLGLPENADSIRRILALQARIPREQPPLEVVGSADHMRIAQEIADRSITVVRSGHGFPLRPSADAKIVVITVHPENLTPADTSSTVDIALTAAIRQRHRNVHEIRVRRGQRAMDILDAARGADHVVVGTIAAERDPAQAELVRALHDHGHAPIVVALRTPYDLLAFPMIDTYLCAYSIRAVSMEAVARVLFGEIEARGVLPCALPDLTAK